MKLLLIVFAAFFIRSFSSLPAQTNAPNQLKRQKKDFKSDFQTRTGDTLYVWDASIYLHRDPSPDAESLAGIPAGAKVVVTDEYIGQSPFTSYLTQPFTKKTDGKEPLYYLGLSVAGHWLQVRWMDKTGYVFDALLSHFPVFYLEQIQYVPGDTAAEPSVFRYFDRIYARTSTNHFMAGASSCEFDLEQIEGTYSNGLVINYGDFGDCGTADNNVEKTTELHLKGISMTEAVLIARQLFKAYNNRYVLEKDGNLMSDDGGGNGFIFSSPAYSITINRENKEYVVLRYSPLKNDE